MARLTELVKGDAGQVWQEDKVGHDGCGSGRTSIDVVDEEVCAGMGTR